MNMVVLVLFAIDIRQFDVQDNDGECFALIEFKERGQKLRELVKTGIKIWINEDQLLVNKHGY